MQKTWVLVADGARARILEMPRGSHQLREIQDFFNPEGRAKSRDLITDGFGRYYGKGERSQGHVAPPGMDPVEHDMDLFSVELCETLEKARAENRYRHLCLIAPPKFLGMLRRHLSPQTLKLIAREIPKDLSRADAKEIQPYVKNAVGVEQERGWVSNVPKR